MPLGETVVGGLAHRRFAHRHTRRGGRHRVDLWVASEGASTLSQNAYTPTTATPPQSILETCHAQDMMRLGGDRHCDDLCPSTLQASHNGFTCLACSRAHSFEGSPLFFASGSGGKGITAYTWSLDGVSCEGGCSLSQASFVPKFSFEWIKTI